MATNDKKVNTSLHFYLESVGIESVSDTRKLL